MKTTIKKIFAAVLAAFMLSSCSDFLTREPYDSINPDNLTSQDDVLAMVNGAYQPLQWAKLYNMRIWTLDIIAGNSEVGAGGGEDGIETIQMADFIADSENFAALDLWRGPSPGILRCNMVLQSIETVPMDEALRTRSFGEVSFLRAHYYFILVRLFGGVPKITEPQKVGEDGSIPKQKRASADEIYELIISDLENAIGALPYKSEYATNDLGRATKEAAMAELARVYLTRGENYNRVVQLCEDIEARGYDLCDDYSDNFTIAGKNGPESIFEVQYYGKTNADFWADENQSSWLSTYTGPRNSNMVAGGWGWNQPTAEFVAQYEDGDQRFDKTVLHTNGPAFDGMYYNSSWSTTGYNLRKFLVPKGESPDYDTSAANWVVTRFADVLLMKAEALNELGRTTDAEVPLYRVRSRAGLTDRSTIEGLTKDQMREKIFHERRIELAFEGHRWYDLVRRGYDYAREFFYSIGKTNFTQKNMLFPIPLEEMEANELLEQNPGY